MITIIIIIINGCSKAEQEKWNMFFEWSKFYLLFGYLLK